MLCYAMFYIKFVATVGCLYAAYETINIVLWHCATMNLVDIIKWIFIICCNIFMLLYDGLVTVFYC